LGKGTAMLVAKPRSLREALRTLELCAKADVAVLPQGPSRWAPGLAVGGSIKVPGLVNVYSLLWKIAIDSDFSHEKLCFFIVMLT